MSLSPCRFYCPYVQRNVTIFSQHNCAVFLCCKTNSFPRINCNTFLYKILQKTPNYDETSVHHGCKVLFLEGALLCRASQAHCKEGSVAVVRITAFWHLLVHLSGLSGFTLHANWKSVLCMAEYIMSTSFLPLMHFHLFSLSHSSVFLNLLSLKKKVLEQWWKLNDMENMVTKHNKQLDNYKNNYKREGGTSENLILSFTGRLSEVGPQCLVQTSNACESGDNPFTERGPVMVSPRTEHKMF